MKKTDEVATLAEQLRKLIDDDQVVELRALHVENGSYSSQVVGGFFDGSHRREMAKAALELSPKATGVYFTLNALDQALLARRANRTARSKEGDGAKDKDVISRRWLLIDADPNRAAGISATDSEKNKAREVALNVRIYLRGLGWPEPILNDSGNGFHLLYRIDLPADDGGLVKDILWILAHRLDTIDVKIDQSVFNAARICKLPGTLSRKGDSTPDRPHRRSAILECPESVQVVPRNLLESLATQSRAEQEEDRLKVETERNRNKPTSTTDRSEQPPWLFVENWLRDKGINFRTKSERDDKGRMVYVLDACPFDSSHGKDACVMQGRNGELSAKCFHNGCKANGWAQFRDRIGKPEQRHYDPATLSGKRREDAPRKDSSSGAKPADAPANAPKLISRSLAEIETSEIEWLWPGRIPCGMFTMLDGDPSHGKSLITLDIAARLSRGGPMPLCNEAGCEPSGVLIIAAEDAAEQVIKPRCITAGCDERLIRVSETIRIGKDERPIRFPDDFDLLEREIKEFKIKLVIVDPLLGFLSQSIDSHKDQSIRDVLHRLKIMADITRAAILGLRHLSKSGGAGNSLYRGLGSIGITAAARSALIVDWHPNEEGVRVLATSKCNLVQMPRSVTYRISDCYGHPVITWGNECDVLAADLGARIDKSRTGAKANAEAFLKETLRDGPIPETDIEAMANNLGISKRTLDRAKSNLKIGSDRNEFTGGKWVWVWPGKSHEGCQIPD